MQRSPLETYFHQPSPTLERLHSLQYLTIGWGPKLGSYKPVGGHLRFRYKDPWLETSRLRLASKRNFKRSAVCHHVLSHVSIEVSMKYLMMVAVLGWTATEKGGKQGHQAGGHWNNVVINSKSDYSFGSGNGTGDPDVKGSTFHISAEMTGRKVRMGREDASQMSWDSWYCLKHN